MQFNQGPEKTEISIEDTVVISKETTRTFPYKNIEFYASPSQEYWDYKSGSSFPSANAKVRNLQICN